MLDWRTQGPTLVLERRYNLLSEYSIGSYFFKGIKLARGSKKYDKISHYNTAKANITALKTMIQVFSLNTIWYKPDLLLDLSPDKEKAKIVEETFDLFHKMSFCSLKLEPLILPLL